MPRTSRATTKTTTTDPTEDIERAAERRVEHEEARAVAAAAATTDQRCSSCGDEIWRHTRDERRACELREAGGATPPPAPVDEPEEAPSP